LLPGTLHPLHTWQPVQNFGIRPIHILATLSRLVSVFAVMRTRHVELTLNVGIDAERVAHDMYVVIFWLVDSILICI
jgi:hypothetical protein